MIMQGQNQLTDQHHWHAWTFHDDDYTQDNNSTCAQWTSCTPCLDYFGGESDEDCLWCSVPKLSSNNDDSSGSGSSTGGSGGGLCLPRSKAQDRCEIGELQATCDEGVGWYVLVLTLCALMCCCCFLTMARKFAAAWHERRWAAAGGELARPLLEEDGEEQAHEAVIRSSLSDAGASSWQCPVCGFDNRPLCKHCDLCGIGSDFAEAYWKEKTDSKRKNGRSKQASGPRVEEKPHSPTAGSGTRRGGCSGEVSSGPEAVERTQDESANEDNGDGDVSSRTELGEKRAEESDFDADADESARLLSSSSTSFAPAVPARLGSLQGDNSPGDAAEDADPGGELGWGYGGASARIVSEKSRMLTFRLRRTGTLTERQKRARRRRIWQRVVASNGKVCWLHTLQSPAKAASAAAAATSSTTASGAPPSSSGTRNSPSLPSSGPAASFNIPAGQATGPAGMRAGAAAVLRYWATPRSYRPPPTPPTPTLAAFSVSDDSVSAADAAASGVSGDGDVSDAISTTATDGFGERTMEALSDAERGEGPSFSPRGDGSVPLTLGSFGEVGKPHGSGEARTGVKGNQKDSTAAVVSVAPEASALRSEELRQRRADSFGDEEMMVACPGYYTTFLKGGGLAWDEAGDGEEVARPNPPPPSATRRGPTVGEGLSSDSNTEIGTGSGNSTGTGAGTGPAARRAGWIDGAARRREARREAEASEEWITSTRADVAKLCEIAAMPFWQKHSWFLDQLRLLQVPHGAGMEAMRIEVNRNNLLEDSFAQVSAMNTGELRRWLRVQFAGEPGVDAGGLEREWFLLICNALFDPSTGLFTPQPGNGAFAINPSSGVANEMHLEYFRFTGRVLGKLLMEHSVAPYHMSVPILKHLLGLPIAFSDLEFADAELYRNLKWLRANPGAAALGLDFTVTLESFGVKEVVELQPGGREVVVSDDNKTEYLKLRLKHRVLGGIHDQLWNLMSGFYDVIPSHLISVFDYQELELLLCGIPEIDVLEWKRYSRYLGEYRRNGEDHPVIKWFWEVVEGFSEEEKARFLQFCTGTSRLPPHGFKALQSNDGSFRAFSIQSITKRESAFPRAHTCFNKLDLPIYDTKKELEECLRLCICFELTGFTID